MTDRKQFSQTDYPLQFETDRILGTAIRVHKKPGAGFPEIVYKDALEYEFSLCNILNQREKEYRIRYDAVILPHKFFADFVVFDKVILKVKSKEGRIAEEDYAHTLNYLRVSCRKVGLIVNFGKMKLDISRVVF
jgi:GxxExxY protein